MNKYLVSIIVSLLMLLVFVLFAIDKKLYRYPQSDIINADFISSHSNIILEDGKNLCDSCHG